MFQGFWELTCIEIENCNSRFNDLIKMKEQNWVVVETTPSKAKIPVKKNKSKNPVKKNGPTKPRGGGIRDMIRAARLKKKDLTDNDNFVILENGPKADEIKTAKPSLRRISTPRISAKPRKV